MYIDMGEGTVEHFPVLLVDREYAVGDLLARAHLGDAHRLQVGLGEAEEGVEGGHLVRLEQGQVLGEVEAEEDALEVGELSEKVCSGC